jgi:hypothetical protein
MSSHAPRNNGAIIIGDLIGKLGVLRIECAESGRAGQYPLAHLIARYGRAEKLFTWTDEMTAWSGLVHVRFGTPNGLQLNVAPGPKSANCGHRRVTHPQT